MLASEGPYKYRRKQLVVHLAWLVIAAALTNAMLFTYDAAIPLVISDAWYYLDVFVRKALDGTIDFADLFVKRGPQDHSLPLHKLVLLANVHWFGLDFTLDSFVGLFFAFGFLLLLYRVLCAGSDGFRNNPVALLAYATICAVYLSLNSNAIFEWPLLTLGFSVQFFFLLLFVASWHAVRHGRYIAVGTSATLALVIADGGGIIAVIAAGLGVILLAARGEDKSRASIVIVILAGLAVLYRIAIGVISPWPSTGNSAKALLDILARPAIFLDILTWLRIALSDSVVHALNLEQRFGAEIKIYQVVISCSVALGHVWFWWQAIRRTPTIVWSVAICTMLLFYGLLAGIIITRIPEFGNDYLHQPRYVIFYQLNVIALMMMGVATLSESSSDSRINLSRVAVVLASIILLLVQVQVSKYGWQREPFREKYVEQLALQMGELARDPDNPPHSCLPHITICRQPAEKRRELMGILRENKLNVFSPEFRARHELQIE